MTSRQELVAKILSSKAGAIEAVSALPETAQEKVAQLLDALSDLMEHDKREPVGWIAAYDLDDQGKPQVEGALIFKDRVDENDIPLYRDISPRPAQVQTLDWQRLPEIGWSAATPFGDYVIHVFAGLEFTVTRRGLEHERAPKFTTLDAAKAFAQQDFHARALACFVARDPSP